MVVFSRNPKFTYKWSFHHKNGAIFMKNKYREFTLNFQKLVFFDNRKMFWFCHTTGLTTPCAACFSSSSNPLVLKTAVFPGNLT